MVDYKERDPALKKLDETSLNNAIVEVYEPFLLYKSPRLQCVCVCVCVCVCARDVCSFITDGVVQLHLTGQEASCQCR